MKVLGVILNGLWRAISAFGIMIIGAYIIGAAEERLTYNLGYNCWNLWSAALILVIVWITTIGFSLLQALKSKDVFHIEVKIKKEVDK